MTIAINYEAMSMSKRTVIRNMFQLGHNPLNISKEILGSMMVNLCVNLAGL